MLAGGSGGRQREGLLDIPGQWFTEWENRYNVMRSQSQKMAIINSSQEWARLRKIQFGGKTASTETSTTMLLSGHLFAEQLAAILGNN